MATAPGYRLTAQKVSHAIITAAMKVHTELGAGLIDADAVSHALTRTEAAGWHAVRKERGHDDEPAAHAHDGRQEADDDEEDGAGPLAVGAQPTQHPVRV